MSTDNTCTVVVKDRPAKVEPPPQLDNCVDSAFFIKLNPTLEVILVLGWGVFIHQYQFNELGDHMSKLEKGQNVNKSAEETAVELDSEMSMYAKLIRNLITLQVTAVMARKRTV